MSGIAGAAGPFLADAPSSLPKRMLDKLAHRGGDPRGMAVLADGKLHFRSNEQLASTDRCFLAQIGTDRTAASGARVPLVTVDGRLTVAFDGRLYNSDAVKQEIEAAGHSCGTGSSSEVLLSAFRAWGTEGLARIEGMWAAAIFDAHENRLVLARDFLGMKPLFYWISDRGVVFGSEMKALLECGNVRRDVDPESLYLFLRWGISDTSDRTMFDHIKHVPPAHSISVDLDHPFRTQRARYWTLDSELTTDLTFDEAATRLRELLLESVSSHLAEPGPVGAGLSGGIDSSSVVMAMRHILGPSQELHTFSYIAAGTRFSEEQWVDIVGAAANATVHKTSPNAEDMRRALPEVTWQQEEPLGSPSVFAQQRVYEVARDAGMVAVLDGLCADGILGGHNYYILDRVQGHLNNKEYGKAIRLVRAALRNPELRQKSFILKNLSLLLPAHLRKILKNLSGNGPMPSWMDADWFRQAGAPDPAHLFSTDPSTLRQHMLRGVFGGGAARLLRYAERSSAAANIECRVPYASRAIVEFAFSIPEVYLVDDNGRTKAVLRKAMRGLVPDVILDRKDKVGFNTPLMEWLDQDPAWVQTTLAEGIERGVPVRTADLAWSSHTRTRPRIPTGYLWRAVALAVWADVFNAEFRIA